MSGPVYTLMADCGVGEFLWYKDGEPYPVVGTNVYSLMDVEATEPPVSDELFFDMRNWVSSYMDSLLEGCVHGDDFNWPAFNRVGMQLARRLKAELSSDCRVVYGRAHDDPSRIRAGFIDVETGARIDIGN